MPATPPPAQIAQALEKRIVGQKEAVREMSVALSKKLARLKVGNILLIGSSGSGKTTLMQAVEGLLASSPALALRSTVVRVHANVLGEEAEQGHPGEKLLRRLLERAREQLGEAAPVERLVEQATHGLVFVDEVDKIRSQVGGQPNVAGIRAQEALLTLIENESVPVHPARLGRGSHRERELERPPLRLRRRLRGALRRRLLPGDGGRDQGALRPVTVVDEDGRAREELQFSLRDWLKTEDLFEYGVSPQFLSRFDAVVLLEPLGEEALTKIFVEGADRACARRRPTSRASAAASRSPRTPVQRIVREAARQPRLGARALKEVFRRVVAPLEFDPHAAAGEKGVVRIDLARVKEALARDQRGGSASTTSGWDRSFSG